MSPEESPVKVLQNLPVSSVLKGGTISLKDIWMHNEKTQMNLVICSAIGLLGLLN